MNTFPTFESRNVLSVQGSLKANRVGFGAQGSTIQQGNMWVVKVIIRAIITLEVVALFEKKNVGPHS